MNLRKRRDCCVLGQCLLFTTLEHYNDRIVEKYEVSSKNIVEEGTKMLEKITAQYLASRNKDSYVSSSEVKEVQFEKAQDFEKSSKKGLICEEEEIWETEPKRFYSFDKSAMKADNCVIPGKSKKKRMTEAEELHQSLKKLDLEEHPQNLEGSGDENQNFDISNMQSLNQKTVAELIYESNKKAEEAFISKKKSQPVPEEVDSDSSYPLTDYSSNESSNDNDYEQYQKISDGESNGESHKTFSNIGSAVSSSQPMIGVSGYQASKLMFSPKKSKSKAKRKFIRDNKIPRWAADLQQVSRQVLRQRADVGCQPAEIYGICLVQKLDTNVIFKGSEFYNRGSSAKWHRHPYSDFE